MRDLREAVPSEEEQTDERRLEEECHQAFDGERRAEDVADIVAVVAPVHAELEFHDDAGGDAHGEVDAEERSPEERHPPPDLAAGHHVDALHDGHDDRQAERQGNEEEVVHRRRSELQAGEIDDREIYHGAAPGILVPMSGCLAAAAAALP
jgi:hypothetical protein